MRSLSILALSLFLLAPASALAAGTCTDAEGFCPFRGGAAAADENCLAMADGEKPGCCGGEEGKSAGCCGDSAEKAGCCAGMAEGAGCCGGEKAEGAGCADEKPEGDAAPHVHPGA